MKMLMCDDDKFVVKGNTEEEVVGKMLKHVREAHNEKMRGKSDEDIKKMMKERVKDV